VTVFQGKNTDFDPLSAEKSNFRGAGKTERDGLFFSCTQTVTEGLFLKLPGKKAGRGGGIR
jgi:hypothetical protein